MNILLTQAGIEGKDEFVTTPAPNEYMVTIRITPEQAKAFNGHERIMIHMGIDSDDHAGVAEVYSVNDDNTRGDYVAFGDGLPTDEQAKVLTDTEDQVHPLVVGFYNEVKDDLGEYYSESENELAAALRQLLG